MKGFSFFIGTIIKGKNMLPIYIVESILVPLIVAPFSFLKSSPF